MDYYDSKNFNTMQQEAIRRVHEMQKRSRNLVNGISEDGDSEGSSDSQKTSQAPRQSESFNTNGKNGGSSINGIINNLFGSRSGEKNNTNRELFNIAGIKIDEEKALIALMIYILYKNGADIKLLLGLGYLLI